VDVLVTGASGFVGHHLVAQLLSEGHRVTGVVRPGTGEAIPAGIAVREADITDPAVVAAVVGAAAPDALIHLAGASSVGASFADPRGTWDVNLGGTLSVLEAVRASATPPRTLIITSGEVYGLVAVGELPVGEDTPLCPVSPYGASKAAADLAALQYQRGYGLPVLRIRPLNHIGPGQDARFVLPSLARQIAQAEYEGRREADIRIGNLSTRRDFTDVRDVARAYAALLTKGSPGDPYLVCSGRSLPIADLVTAMVAATPVKVRLVTEPSLVREGEQPDLYGDARRLHDEAGWTPIIDIHQSVVDTLDWWRTRIAS
jgi:GDP-4-dehydro-6-deoxy-D-mannose reductase